MSGDDNAGTGHKRPAGARAVGQLVPGLIAPAARRYGFSCADLVGQWSAIAGTDIAARCTPERIAWPRTGPDPESDTGKQAATLHVRAAAHDILAISHETGVIAERLNAYFGYRAIERVVVHRDNEDSRAGHTASTGADASNHGEPLEVEEVEGVRDDALKAALGELAGHVRAQGGTGS